MSPEGATKTAATLAALEDIEEDKSFKPPPKSGPNSVSEVKSFEEIAVQMEFSVVSTAALTSFSSYYILHTVIQHV